MNLHTMTVNKLPDELRARLIQQGQFTTHAIIGDPYNNLDTFRRKGVAVPPQTTGIPALDQEVKSSGAVNSNNLAYIEISRNYLHNDLYAIRQYPREYGMSVLKAYCYFFLPSSQVWTLDNNRDQIQGIDRAFNLILSGQPICFASDHNIQDVSPNRTFGSYFRVFLHCGMFLFFGLPLLAFYSYRLIRRELSGLTPDYPLIMTLAFMLITILYTVVTSSLLQLGENNRFRFPLDPYLMIMFGLLLKHVWPRRSPALVPDNIADNGVLTFRDRAGIIISVLHRRSPATPLPRRSQSSYRRGFRS
jgi:hypothetical protein